MADCATHTSVSIPTTTIVRRPTVSIAVRMSGWSAAPNTCLAKTGVTVGAAATTGAAVGPFRAASSSVTMIGTSRAAATAVNQATRSSGPADVRPVERRLGIDDQEERVIPLRESGHRRRACAVYG